MGGLSVIVLMNILLFLYNWINRIKVKKKNQLKD